ncbi:MAG TPA: hypothetical protein VHW23_22730 [Kofleriaceae bacterium]|nr:hypothetical protein [Kofleriaceae bacterium]
MAAVLGAGGAAEAGRKRVVVLDFDGPKGDKFHDDLVRLIKKSHTVVPTDKWTGAAGQLGAGTLSGKDVKKVARKLKIDAVVEGKIEKRRDEFIIRLKLHAGKSGELVGESIDTKAEGPRIDGRAQKDLKDELVGAIDNIEANHDGEGGDDEADDPPAHKASKSAKVEADDDDKPARKSARAEKDDDDDKLPAKKTAKKTARKDDDDADDDRAARRSKFGGRFDDERGTDKVGKGKKPEASADDEDDKPSKKTAKAAKPAPADDEDDKPAKKTAKAAKPVPADDDDKLPPRKPAAKPAPADDTRVAAKDPPKKPAAKSGDDSDDKLPPKKPASKSAAKKKVAARDDDDAAEVEAEGKVAPLEAGAALSPAERFLDAAAGLSFTQRQLLFSFSPKLRAVPPSYKGVLAPGATVDVTAYPLAFGHSRRDVYKDIGLELTYDRVLKLNSKAPTADGMSTVTYSTLESRFALTGVFRYAFNSSPTSPVVLGTLGYQRQQFNILGKVSLPDVKYSMFAPGAGIRFPVISKLTLGADAKLLLITSTGMIQDPDQYGTASVFGFDGTLGADYLVTPNIFVRAAGRYEFINFTFKGTGVQSNGRDGDPTTQDVSGAKDSYLGGMVTVGYVY